MDAAAMDTTATDPTYVISREDEKELNGEKRSDSSCFNDVFRCAMRKDLSSETTKDMINLTLVGIGMDHLIISKSSVDRLVCLSFVFAKDWQNRMYILPKKMSKGRLSYHLWVECFSQLSFDSEMYTKSAAVADFVYTSESNESCEKHSTQRW